VRDRLKILTGSGIAVFLFGFIAGYLKLDAQFHHMDVATRPAWNPWIDPPYSPFERFILNFPVSPFLIAGCALLLVASIWALIQKYRN